MSLEIDLQHLSLIIFPLEFVTLWYVSLNWEREGDTSFVLDPIFGVLTKLFQWSLKSPNLRMLQLHGVTCILSHPFTMNCIYINYMPYGSRPASEPERRFDLSQLQNTER